jgi:integrase
LRFVALRQALGFQTRPTERLLLDFIAFAESRGHADAVTAQLAVDWACGGPAGSSRRSRAQRLSVVRGFLVYVRASVPRTEVPAVGLLRGARRPTPHIFSDAEIAALLRAARALGPGGSLRPHTYATLVGLLASCGIRIGEAVRLRPGDVRLDSSPPVLHVGESKFHKSRLVALHPTVAV